MLRSQTEIERRSGFVGSGKGLQQLMSQKEPDVDLALVLDDHLGWEPLIIQGRCRIMFFYPRWMTTSVGNP